MMEVYEQVMITCTTINSYICIAFLAVWIIDKVIDHRRKKDNRKQ